MKRKILRTALVIILIGSTFFLIKDTQRKNEENRQLEEIQYEVKTNANEEDSSEGSLQQQKIAKTTEQEEQENVAKEVLAEYSNLYEENSDMCGWLKIKNTVIDYPVMFTKENPNFYLHKDWNKEESTHGLIYIDERSDLDKSDNLIFYGHCMKDGTMFGSLKNYKEESYYADHSIIEYNTLYEKGKYEVISVFIGEAYYSDIPDGTFIYYNCINFNTQDEFDYFYSNIKELSMYETEVEAEYGDKFITLSTCSYEFENARTVVIAKKIE